MSRNQNGARWLAGIIIWLELTNKIAISDNEINLMITTFDLDLIMKSYYVNPM